MSIALSYSRLSTYQQCPKKFKEQFITKTYPDDSDNIYFKKGKKKHGQLDNYIKSKNDPTIIQLRYDGDVLNGIKIVDGLISQGFSVTAESQLAVAEGFMPCTWYDKKTIYRAICDMIAQKNEEAVVGDWKTGQYRDYDGSPTGQLHLAAGIVFSHMPHINIVKTAYFYIEHKQTVIRQFTRNMYETNLLIPFYDSFITVNQDGEFAPRRNPYCNFCLIKNRCELYMSTQPK